MDTIPAAFISVEERQKAKLVTEKISELKAKFPDLFQNTPEVDVEKNIENTQNNLEAQIENGDKVYFHFTAQLERIIKSGALKPRVNVPESERVTTTGSHSMGVHFGTNCEYAPYSTYKTEREGIFGIAYPLSEIVTHTPYRAEGRDAHDNVFYNSYKITGESNKGTRGGTDYEYPISEGVIFVPEIYRDTYEKLLEDAGYNEEFIQDHLLVISQENTYQYSKITELVAKKLEKLLHKKGRLNLKVAPLSKTKQYNRYGGVEHLDGGRPGLIEKLVVI